MNCSSNCTGDLDQIDEEVSDEFEAATGIYTGNNP
jgi:hypothetical protein